MHQKQSIFNWKKLIVVLFILLILTFIVFAYLLYYSIEKSKQDGFKDVEEYIYSETDMVTVENLTYFQEKEGYYIAEAIDEQGEYWYLFLLDDKSEPDYDIIKESANIKDDDVKADFYNDCKDCQLKSINPAYINHIPLWEITYIDQDKKYVIEYKYFEDGTTYEKLRFTRKFRKG